MQIRPNVKADLEQRLYTYPLLVARMEDNAYYPGGRSKSIVKFTRMGRVPPEQAAEAIEQYAQAARERDAAEIETLDAALSLIKDDPYYEAIKQHYLVYPHCSDEYIAETKNCDRTTICRNRNRLIAILAVRLYGVDAYDRATTVQQSCNSHAISRMV